MTLTDIDTLSNWQDNYNQGDIGLIATIIDTYGYNRSISVWRDGVVMAGNHTLLALKSLKAGAYDVPANVSLKDGQWLIETTSCAHLDYEAACDYAIADNRAAARASHDEKKLIDMLKGISASDEKNNTNRLETIGYDGDDIVDMMKRNGLLKKDEEPGAGNEANETTPGEKAQAVWQVEAGDSFIIESSWGFSHRVTCGDAFDVNARAALLDDIIPDIVHADPPYGLDINKGGTKQTGKSQNYDGVTGDDSPFDPAPLLEWANAVIIWGANHYANRLPASPFWLVWDKQGGAKDIDFATIELAYCNVSKPARMITHVWDGWRRDSEVGIERFHINQKPIAVIVWALEWLEGRYVFEPFGGSGTTLLACEQIGRQCFIMDINPAMVAIMLERFTAAGLEVSKQ